MIEQFLRPASIDEALRLMAQSGGEAVFMAGGSKLNAAPTRTRKKIAISLAGLGLGGIGTRAGQLRIGAAVTLQQLIDDSRVPAALRTAAGFVYSRNVRNQATLGGEICARQDEALLLPVLLVMEAQLALAGGATVDLEGYLAGPRDALVVEIVLPEPALRCAVRKVAPSAGALTVLSAAVAASASGQRIAVDGVVPQAMRLRDVEKKGLSGDALQQAVAAAVAPHADLRGSVDYKRYIAGVVVADLVADCLKMNGGK